MFKKLLAIIFILSLFSCELEVEEGPAYAGTWRKIITSNQTIELIIDEDSYSVNDILTSNLTGVSTTTEIERGTLTKPTGTVFTLTRTHLYESGTLQSIPVSMQVPSDVTWSVSGSQLTLVDNVNTYTSGTFTKQ